MFKGLRTLLLIAASLLLAGCVGGAATTDAPEYEADTDGAVEPLVCAFEAPLFYESLEELLAAVGMAKFSEFAGPGTMEPFAAGDGEIETRGFGALAGLDALFEPQDVKDGFGLDEISVYHASSLTFLHSDSGGAAANFIWTRSISADNAITDFFGRGAVAEYFVELGSVDNEIALGKRDYAIMTLGAQTGYRNISR